MSNSITESVVLDAARVNSYFVSSSYLHHGFIQVIGVPSILSPLAKTTMVETAQLGQSETHFHV